MSKSAEIIASIAEFFSMLSGGFLIAFAFDVFRKMRKAVRRNNGRNFIVTVYLQDVIFLLFAFVVLVLLIYRVNGGRIDWYISLGCVTGAIAYYYLAEPIAGRLIFAVFFAVVRALRIIKNVIRKVLLKIKFLKRSKKSEKKLFFLQKKLKKAGETQLHDI